MNVERYLSLAEAFNVYVLQVPAYHLVIELFLVAWIAKLLLTKNFTPARVSKSEKPTKEVNGNIVETRFLYELYNVNLSLFPSILRNTLQQL